MSIKSNTPALRFALAVMTYLLITVVMSVVWYIITKEVLIKLQSVSAVMRDGYDNPFLSHLAILSIYLLVAFVLYGIINALLSKFTSSMAIKVLIGVIAGLFPICFVHLTTFGLPLTDPSMLIDITIMAISGGLLPVVQNLIAKFIKGKSV